MSHTQFPAGKVVIQVRVRATPINSGVRKTHGEIRKNMNRNKLFLRAKFSIT